MPKGSRIRPAAARSAGKGAAHAGRSHAGGGSTSHRIPSRIAKQRVLERIRQQTLEVNGGSLLTMLRRQGYEELPLDEIQDRLSKLRTALAEFIVSRRV